MHIHKDSFHQSKSVVSAKADSEITAKEQAQKQLDAYAQELHTRRPVINKSLYELYEAYAAKNAAPDTDWFVPDLPTKGDAYLAETIALLNQYIAYVPSIGEDYRKNPWFGYCNQDNTYQTKTQMRTDLQTVVPLLQALVPLQNELHTRFGTGPETVANVQTWSTALRFLATTKAIAPAALTKDRFAQTESAVKELQGLSEEILANRANLDEAFDAELYQIDGTEMEKQLTRRFGSFFSRLFNAEYKAMRGQVLLCKKAGGSLPYPNLVSTVHKLAVTQQKSAEFESLAQSVADCLGEAYNGLETDWSELVAQLDSLRVFFEAGITFGQLPNYTKESYAAERGNFANYAERLTACAEALHTPYDALADSFAPEIYDARASSAANALAKFDACLHEIDKLDNWCYFRTLLAQLEEKQVVPFIVSEIEQHRAATQLADTFAKKFYYQWIDATLNASPVLARFNRIGQDQAIQTFSQKDVEQFEINKAKIRAELSSHRPSLDMVAAGSAMALLLREGEKKRKQKNIRSLLSEAGSLIQILKPCFMMSPLSVSTFLASGAVHFDVVVFDEASQIFPEDAIGAIYRGDQLIVVGDSKQMPPSNFFNATLDVDTDDEEAGDVTDFESILDLCSTSLQQLRLCWHYRSRYEQLIAFSNKNFYDGDLVTFPSSRADAPGVGVDYYHVEGIFDRRSHTNRKEAEFIVDLIYRNIEQYPDRSLGVVAFSVAQQDLIDRLLSQRRQATPEREAFFKEAKAEPFFIKNLETVQGDERDTIIFSVAYGIDAQGRLLHNFGPLNRVGGERRLNVAVTRAKCNVQLVSSMHCTDIDLKRTSAEGARLLREYLDFAENGNIALERTMSVSAYEQFDSDFEMQVYDFLREKGFTVDTQVGCSGFKIDLGLRRPDSSDYVLAIECDGATYHSSKNARDRDRLRQEILERMGWKFYRIWSTDWFRNQPIEKSRLLEAAAEAVTKPANPPAGQSAQEARHTETFEEVAQEAPFEFPKYQAAEVDALLKRYMPWNYKGLVKEILAVEAPLSEELLLKRTVQFFDREKVTAAVQRQYEEEMSGCQFSGILRKDGFLSLKGQPEVHFRAAGDTARDIKYIALEELADGLLQILKQNRTADKSGLYRALAQQCGVARVGKAISDRFDAALALLDDKVSVSEGLVILNADVM